MIADNFRSPAPSVPLQGRSAGLVSSVRRTARGRGTGAVGHRPVGIVVDFDDQAVRAHGDCGARQRRDLVRLPVPWLGSTTMGRWLSLWTAGTSSGRACYACGRRKSAPRARTGSPCSCLRSSRTRPPSAILPGWRHAALEQHRLAGASGALEQREILHVAGADLDHVGILLPPGPWIRCRWPR